jgi:hypothetical protein
MKTVKSLEEAEIFFGKNEWKSCLAKKVEDVKKNNWIDQKESVRLCETFEDAKEFFNGERRV